MSYCELGIGGWVGGWDVPLHIPNRERREVGGWVGGWVGTSELLTGRARVLSLATRTSLAFFIPLQMPMALAPALIIL